MLHHLAVRKVAKTTRSVLSCKGLAVVKSLLRGTTNRTGPIALTETTTDISNDAWTGYPQPQTPCVYTRRLALPAYYLDHNCEITETFLSHLMA